MGRHGPSSHFAIRTFVADLTAEGGQARHRIDGAACGTSPSQTPHKCIAVGHIRSLQLTYNPPAKSLVSVDSVRMYCVPSGTKRV